MQKHNLQPATIEITNVLKKIMLCRLPTMQNLSRRRKQGSKKKKVDQSKQILDKEIKEVEGKIDHLMESSKLLEKNFLSQ